MKSGKVTCCKQTLDDLLSGLNKAAQQVMTEIRADLRILTLTGLDHNLQHLYVDLHNINVVQCDVQIYLQQQQQKQQQQLAFYDACCNSCLLL